MNSISFLKTGYGHQHHLVEEHNCGLGMIDEWSAAESHYMFEYRKLLVEYSGGKLKNPIQPNQKVLKKITSVE